MVENEYSFVDKVVPTTIAVTFSIASLLSTTTFTAATPKQAIMMPVGSVDSVDSYTSKGYQNVLGVIPSGYDTNVLGDIFSADVIEVNGNQLDVELKQIKDVLPQYLSVKDFLVEKINDSEDGDEIFMVFALTDMDIEQALDGLEKFNKLWWIDHYNPAICIDVIAI